MLIHQHHSRFRSRDMPLSMHVHFYCKSLQAYITCLIAQLKPSHLLLERKVLTCSSNMTYLYSIFEFAGSSTCNQTHHRHEIFSVISTIMLTTHRKCQRCRSLPLSPRDPLLSTPSELWLSTRMTIQREFAILRCKASVGYALDNARSV